MEIINDILSNKTIKPKEKTEAISEWIKTNPDKVNNLIELAATAKDPIKATIIESMEYASKTKPDVASIEWLHFVSDTLSAKAPRIKWESAKVIGNIAHRYPESLDQAISNLLINSEHSGTVVRWSAAFALGEIIKLSIDSYSELIDAVENIMNREEKPSIKKIYQAALKKVKKNG